MAIEPDHAVWKRARPDHHAGAVRNYLKDPDDDGYPRGPNMSPRKCADCDTGSGYDSASPESVSWYVSSGDSSPGAEETIFERPNQSTFDMKGSLILCYLAHLNTKLGSVNDWRLSSFVCRQQFAINVDSSYRSEPTLTKHMVALVQIWMS